MRPALLGGCVLVGVVTASAALLAHRQQLRVGEVGLPWGLVLTLVTTYLCARAAALLAGGRGGAAGFAAGWVLVLLLALGGGPGGDYLVAADLRGYGLLLGGPVVLGAAVVLSGVARPAGGARA